MGLRTKVDWRETRAKGREDRANSCKEPKSLCENIERQAELRQRMIKVHRVLHRNHNQKIQSESEENWRSAVPGESRALNDEDKFL